jgi:NAD+ diphosphatase
MKQIAFTAGAIDRLSDLRGQPMRVERALASPDARFLPVWQDKCLVHGDRVALLSRDQLDRATRNAEHFTLLGAVGDYTAFCVPVGQQEVKLGSDYEYVSLREVFARVRESDAALFAYAKAIAAWQDRHRHCGVCGAPNRLREAGFVTECTVPDCGHRSFPRLDPAIIVLVIDAHRCLLGRKSSWPAARFSTIAGFVEPGESLEAALRREVKEETNVEAGACRYLGSQPWPFPAALMIGFHADAVSTVIACNDQELAEARWITREQIVAREITLPPEVSIAYRLIEAWFDDYEGPSLASHALPAPPTRVPRPVDRGD